MKNAILSHLPAEFPWREHIRYFPSIGSTNDHLKSLAKQGAPEGTAILAGHQSCGHGRMGRSFHSPEGMGVYLSILLRPDCAPTALMHLTCATAVAMCDAVQNCCGLRPGIKWTNDLVYGKRKLGGILTKLGLNSAGQVDWAIIGIGINCRQQAADFPPEIRDIASSLEMATGKTVSSDKLAAAMLESLHTMSAALLTQQSAILNAYRRDCVTIGQEVSIVRGEDIRHGTALAVDDAGALVVAYADGTRETVNSGEVSIRGMYGYL